MNKSSHPIHHYRQPTNTSCGQTAAAMVASFYDPSMTVDSVLQTVPGRVNKQGINVGSLSQEIATWFATSGFAVDLYSFDFQIVDLSWSNLDQHGILTCLKAVKPHRNVPSLGTQLSRRYVQSYIDFINAGGTLHIKSHPTSRLLKQLLTHGPLFVNVSSHPLYNIGRLSYPSPKRNVPNDTTGSITTHSIAVYGYNSDTFFVADPWEGKQKVSAEALLCGITAAQIECDNMCFQIKVQEKHKTPTNT